MAKQDAEAQTDHEQLSCFVVSPIGETGSATRRRSDQVLKYLIRPVLEDAGYDVTRADDLEDSGLITVAVMERVHTADLVVADLTGHNANVFYELALRHSLRLPVVHLMDSGERPPFDIADVRTVFVDVTDLDSVDRAKGDLAKMVAASQDLDETAHTPISLARAVSKAIEAEPSVPDADLLSQVMAQLASIRSEVRDLRRTSDSLLTTTRRSPARLTDSALVDFANAGSEFGRRPTAEQMLRNALADPFGPTRLDGTEDVEADGSK